ncbi:hypothetical protein BCV70DRAFT_35931 [Testicularia cyperi]|uniref:Uncharacterized protein n=1 Tax=Testicularia cyperi TaxID=1882483 RepID=A0A317XJI8_9BASI|nr:hypothetical protein BCV70DRAFT_35931 [Testicularia cyperi]
MRNKHISHTRNLVEIDEADEMGIASPCPTRRRWRTIGQWSSSDGCTSKSKCRLVGEARAESTVLRKTPKSAINVNQAGRITLQQPCRSRRWNPCAYSISARRGETSCRSCLPVRPMGWAEPARVKWDCATVPQVVSRLVRPFASHVNVFLLHLAEHEIDNGAEFGPFYAVPTKLRPIQGTAQWAALEEWAFVTPKIASRRYNRQIVPVSA